MPVGAFSGTQIGTDIVLLKKQSQKQAIDISNYFKEHSGNVLGQVREKTNRFGKLEEYVHGNLEEALALIEKDNLQKEENRNGWYVEYNETSEGIRSYKGEKFTPELLECKFYVHKLENNIPVSDSLIRIDLGDGIKVNQEIYNYLNAELLNNQENSKKWNDYKELYKEAIVGSDDFKYKVVENTNPQTKDLAFSTLFDEILTQNRKLNSDLYLKYRKDKEFATSFFNDVKDLCFKEFIIDKKKQKNAVQFNIEKEYKINHIDPQNITNDELEMILKAINQKGKETKALDVIDWFFEEKNNIPEKTREIIFKSILQNANRIEKWKKKELKVTPKVNSKVNLKSSNNTEKQLSLFGEETNNTKNDVVKTIPTQNQLLEKVKTALKILHQKNFKTPNIYEEIEKYEELVEEITNEKTSFDKEDFILLAKEADNIINAQAKSKDLSKYQIQTVPELKKGILKYQFKKNDEIVDSSLQNNANLTQEQIESFKDTNYDGTLNNRVKHYKYANYIGGKWVHDFYYAEGNIYAKLEQLELDFIDKHANGGTENQYEKQKALLESVLPKEKPLNEIIISPNHEFIHKFSLGTKEKLYYNDNTKKQEIAIVDYSLADKFKDFVRELPYPVFRGSSYWEVQGFVDNETVTGSDKERNALVRERRKEVANELFLKFIEEEMTSEEKERFVKEFNRHHNNIHIPNYSQFPLFSKIYKNFKGSPLRLSEVQKSGIGRLTTKGVGLLAHEVGFGKTLSGILSMHEAMERGMAKRPLVVVPNESILKQWVETIYEVIPNAKVNVLGNLGVNYDLSNFEIKDNEFTIVTYSGFMNIGFDEHTVQNLASRFSYISDNELKPMSYRSTREKQIELQKQKELKGKIQKGKMYSWEDFDFDYLTFDEVHNANHIIGKVRIENRRYASDFRSQNQRTSAIGINTWVACQYIQERYNGRNVTLLSATPFTNKPLEYYSILSLIANNRLEEKGYFNVNTFFETFMEADNEMEIDAKSEVKFKSNVKRFKNNSLFQQLLAEFIDIKGEEDNPELVRPNRINKEYKIAQNDLTEEEYDSLNSSFDEEEQGAILTHILNARLIAISPYLSPYYEGPIPNYKEFVEDSPKLKTTIDLITQNKKDNPNAGQIIYSELAVEKFPELKKYLVKETGFNKKEVAIITGKTSKPQRDKIQEDFNNGKIKIVIGSSAIQEGMNLQTNTSDMYLLSLPYNFTSLRQTEGRAWRQGNIFENVRINYMLTEDSIDVFMLQKLQAKQSRYMEAMKNNLDVLDVSDIDTNELKTALIKSPITRANIEIALEEKRLESEKSRLTADSSFILRKYEKVTKIKNEFEGIKENLVRYKDNLKKEPNDDFWKHHLLSARSKLQDCQKKMSEEIEKLEKNGIDFSSIQRNINANEEQIEKIDKEIENLKVVKEDLINKYNVEAEQKSKERKKINWIEERKEENKSFYTLRKEDKKSKTQEKMVKNKKVIRYGRKTKICF